ncbi:NHLP bacteriocin export ABC transporter permease/ATPase subunit [Neosynechococcus sphagnicola]|uniref:NHLP bacteriocin export ABC transporter permease/ATPase subunit n=1 Tax=Neosynechococcus sphagnicola TaxID=1501145 RepID=UPI0009DD1D55|nr:NHLP bacteriocin export ABC transporter permease/ATPase subunit [Neosynechococcus sphagnicola]
MVIGNTFELTGKPAQTWSLENGFAILFYTSAGSKRRYRLLNIPPGLVIYGLPACKEFSLFVQTLGEGIIYPIEAEFRNQTIARWLETLYGTMQPLLSNPAQLAITDENINELKSGELFRTDAGGCNWIAAVQGNIRWQGYVDLPIGLPIPVTHSTRIEAITSAKLKIIEPDYLGNESQILGLQWIHSQYLSWLSKIHTERIEQEKKSLHDYGYHNFKNIESAYCKLKDVLSGDEINNRDADPLSASLKKIGDKIGIKFATNLVNRNQSLKENLQQISRASRIRMRAVKLLGKWWVKDSGFLLSYWREKQEPIALIPQSGRIYKVFDPSTKKFSLINEDVAGKISDVAFIFTRPLRRELQRAWDLVSFALYGKWLDLGLILVFALFIQILLVHIPAQFYHILIDQAIPDSNYGLLAQLGMGLIGSAIAVAFFQFIQSMILLRVETWAEFDTQSAVWDRVLDLPMNFYRQYSSGGLTNRVFSVTEIRKLLTGSTLQAIISGVISLTNVGMMFLYNPTLTWIAVGLISLITIATLIHAYFILKIHEEMRQMTGNLYGMIVQFISGVTTLQVTGAVPRAFLTWSELYSKRQQLILRTQTWGDSLRLINHGSTIASTAILFGVIGFNLEQGNILTGTFIGFNILYTNFFQNATQFTYTLVSLLPVVTLWRQVEPILKAQLEIKADCRNPGQLQGYIQVIQLCYRYNVDQPFTLNQVNIEASPGEFVAIIGPSGSGKSTLFRLLLGFDQPEAGAIYYDHQELSQLDLPLIRRQIGLVLQHSRLLSGSIYENISCGEDISREQVWEALEKANLADEVAALPMQLETRINESGNNFSGGQIQRLMIARALGHNPKIIFFDEATSALDNQTQASITDTLSQLQATRIVVAHRLSTIRKANRIYVMDRGQIVQCGTFAELMSEQGLFASLASRQLE